MWSTIIRINTEGKSLIDEIQPWSSMLHRSCSQVMCGLYGVV